MSKFGEVYQDEHDGEIVMCILDPGEMPRWSTVNLAWDEVGSPSTGIVGYRNVNNEEQWQRIEDTDEVR